MDRVGASKGKVERNGMVELQDGLKNWVRQLVYPASAPGRSVRWDALPTRRCAALASARVADNLVVHGRVGTHNALVRGRSTGTHHFNLRTRTCKSHTSNESTTHGVGDKDRSAPASWHSAASHAGLAHETIAGGGK